jgi:4-amino-4-deoxy-L-arabinose transferase-like glycosyltransferase
MKFRIDRPIQSLLKQWEEQPVLVWALSGVWLFLVVWIAFWWRLGSTGLLNETEPLFAEASRQMTVTGDWVTPYFNGATRFDKPPLVYWIMAIAYNLFGVNEWSVRLPSALAATVLTALGFYTLRRFGFPRPIAARPAQPQAENFSSLILASPAQHQAKDKSAERSSALMPYPTRQANHQLWLSAWIGAALISLNIQTIAWGRIGVSDMLLNGCMGAALLAFFCGYAQPTNPNVQARWYFAFYGLAALAVLTKGPVGIVLPVLIIAAFLLYMGNSRTVLREMHLLPGIAFFLVLTLPWYVLVIWANGENYINSFFGYHNLERFTQVVNNHKAPFLFYFLVVPIAFVPWSVYLPVAIARLRFWQRHHWQKQPRSSHLGVFALIWFVVIFVFFTIAATKLPSYTIPLLPAAAILIGLFWSDQMTRQQVTRGVRFSHIANIVLLLALAGAILYSPNWMGHEPEMPNLPQLVRQSGIAAWGGWIWAGVAIASLVLLLRRLSYWLWLPGLVGFIAFVILTVLPTMDLIDAQRELPLRQLSAAIVQEQQPEEPLLMVGYGKPSIVFYTQRPVTYITHPDDAVDQLRKLNRRLSKPNAEVHSLLLLARTRKLEETKLEPNQYQTLAEAGVYKLVRIKFPLIGLKES